jgi:hypothetical protein
MKYYYAAKKNEIMSFAGKWVELDSIMLSEMSLTEEDKFLVFSFMAESWAPAAHTCNPS